jgi:predicted dehydrogenase
MTTHERARVGVVGAGFISREYLNTLAASNEVEVTFVADVDAERARGVAEAFSIGAWGTYEQLLASADVDLVVNLTIPAAHLEVTRAALRSGRHVWSEKPLALTLDDARSLVHEAADRGLALGCAPDTFLGQGLQTALTAIDAGMIGTPRSAYANFQYAGPDVWHPDPEFLFRPGGGPLLDMGPYYITALIQAFGPVAYVSAVASMAQKEREIVKGPRAGTRFSVEVDTHVAALYEFVSGQMATVVLSFDSPIRRAALEVSGTSGALVLPDPNAFDGDTKLVVAGEPDVTLPPITLGGQARGTGVVDMVRAIHDGRDPRASGRLAFHVLDVMLTTEDAARRGVRLPISSRITRASLLSDKPSDEAARS